MRGGRSAKGGVVMTTEAALQRSIIVALEAAGCYVVNVVVAGRKGTPDLLVCHEGRFIALEVKRLGQKPTAIQRVELARVAAHGGTAAVVHSVDEARAALEV